MSAPVPYAAGVRAFNVTVEPCDCDYMCGGISLELTGLAGAAVVYSCRGADEAERLAEDLLREARRARLGERRERPS